MQEMLKERLNEYCSYIETNLDEYVQHYCSEKLSLSLPKAMLYSLEAGGKRIRPVLVLEICKILSGDYKKAKSCACAIEMIHTFSLIHDDLPAMDDDDMRRGKPSCHKAFNEAIAVLAGDELATLPYLIIAQDNDLSADAKSKIISVLAKETTNMIQGQIIDIENEGKEISEEILLKLHSNKTCGLLRAACKMGAICADADEETIAMFEEYAEFLGLAFQIIDDILDIVGDEKALGKPVGSDAQSNKTTYATLVGIENARKKASYLTEKAMGILENFDNTAILKQLTQNLLTRNN